MELRIEFEIKQIPEWGNSTGMLIRQMMKNHDAPEDSIEYVDRR
jgi:hypothetical protein